MGKLPEIENDIPMPKVEASKNLPTNETVGLLLKTHEHLLNEYIHMAETNLRKEGVKDGMGLIMVGQQGYKRGDILLGIQPITLKYVDPERHNLGFVEIPHPYFRLIEEIKTKKESKKEPK